MGIRKDFELDEYIESIFPEPDETRIYDLSDVILDPNNVDAKYTLGLGTWDTLRRHKAHHESIGQGFGYGLIEPPFDGKITRTISARYHKDGAEILIDQGEGNRPRRLTPLEACKIQGFPEKCHKFFNGIEKQPVSDTQAYRQFGNSVAVPVVTAIAKNMVNFLKKRKVIR